MAKTPRCAKTYRAAWRNGTIHVRTRARKVVLKTWRLILGVRRVPADLMRMKTAA